jgi:tRNA(Ile)-lysidine synthase
LRLRLLREAIRQTKGDLARISGRHLAAVDALAQGPTPQGELHLPGVTVTRSYDFLAFSPPTPGALETGYQLTVGGPGDYPLPGGGRLVLREADLPFAGEELSESVAWFDRELAPFPWTIRTFQPGDRIVLPGLAGRKKVKELFAEHRLPMATRRRLPLLCSDATLLWVCGMRRGAAARLSPASRSGIRAELLDFPL